MTPTNWNKIKKVLDDVLELSPDKKSFLELLLMEKNTFQKLGKAAEKIKKSYVGETILDFQFFVLL